MKIGSSEECTGFWSVGPYCIQNFDDDCVGMMVAGTRSDGVEAVSVVSVKLL